MKPTNFISDCNNLFVEWQFSNYSFNNQEHDDEVYGDGNSMTAEFWQYDARLGRRWNIDPVPSAFESSYDCFSNNPLFYTDIDGDEVDVSKVSAENQGKLTDDLSKKTGLRVKVENGKLTYETYSEDKDGHKKGEPIIDEGGSKTAQKLLRKSIDSKKVATVHETNGDDATSANRMDVFINFKNIDNKLKDEKGYFAGGGLKDRTTDGYAMTFFHEIQHTKLGGSRNDGLAAMKLFRPMIGPIERKVNNIRVELGLQKNQSYWTYKRDIFNPETGESFTRDITPFSRKTLLKLIFHKKITTKDVYIAD